MFVQRASRPSLWFGGRGVELVYKSVHHSQLSHTVIQYRAGTCREREGGRVIKVTTNNLFPFLSQNNSGNIYFIVSILNDMSISSLLIFI